MGKDKTTKWRPIISKVARQISREFPEVEYEDMVQDLLLYVLSNDKLTSEMADGEWANRGLMLVAYDVAWNYRKQGLYMTSQYAYRNSDVIKLLETLFDYRDWESAILPSDFGKFQAEDSMVVNSDLMMAYKRVGKVFQKTLFDRYAKQMFPKNNADRMKLQRATSRLTDMLNMYKPKFFHRGPGSRTVMGNGQAQAAIEDLT